MGVKQVETDPDVFFTVRIPASMRDSLEALAKRNDRSQAAETRIALRQHLQTNGSDATSPEANARAATKGA